eukprot:CAMPEP_0168519218 /NCGR_PEP_ID=MMETSP0405-20121227/7183_1 /TAXON_ID=498012 /ORGANISM="Trichosphaerium sp, Strain Am-I-7 wt" /LENGTH=114 /DNA_ID=CAMNT_0008539711 /DNA_START=101 /DNA_END=445 /DNA_ORIENTATION=-
MNPNDMIAHYNLSCACSLLGRVQEAFESLEASIKLGYNNLQHLLSDPDLENVRKCPEFEKVIAPLRPKMDPKQLSFLKTLTEMGFVNPEKNIKLLKDFNGNVDQAIMHVLDKGY